MLTLQVHDASNIRRSTQQSRYHHAISYCQRLRHCYDDHDDVSDTNAIATPPGCEIPERGRFITLSMRQIAKLFVMRQVRAHPARYEYEGWLCVSLEIGCRKLDMMSSAGRVLYSPIVRQRVDYTLIHRASNVSFTSHIRFSGEPTVRHWPEYGPC